MPKSAIIIVAVGAAALVLVAVFFAIPLFTPTSPSATVRVGYLTADLHHIAYFVAKNKTVGNGQSFFEKYGVNVTDAVSGGYASGGVEIDAFMAGEVDIGFMGAPPAIIKHLNAGVNTTVIAQVNEIGSALVVKESINSPSNLRDKTIAVPSRSSIQYFLLLNYLEQNSLSINDLANIVEVAPSLMKLKMQSDTVDGFIAWEPFPTDSVISGVGKILATSSDIWPRHLDCVIVADKAFVDKYPNVVVNFLRAHIEATNWVNNAKSDKDSQSYELLVQIGVDFTQRTTAVVEAALSHIDYKFSIDLAFLSTFTTFTDKLIQYKIVTSDTLQNRGYSDVYDFVEKYIDESYLSQAQSG
jgi:NitT/TauT family transport system substrate-binding protein